MRLPEASFYAKILVAAVLLGVLGANSVTERGFAAPAKEYIEATRSVLDRYRDDLEAGFMYVGALMIRCSARSFSESMVLKNGRRASSLPTRL
jgi:hypothetical protein